MREIFHEIEQRFALVVRPQENGVLLKLVERWDAVRFPSATG